MCCRKIQWHPLAGLVQMRETDHRCRVTGVRRFLVPARRGRVVGIPANSLLIDLTDIEHGLVGIFRTALRLLYPVIEGGFVVSTVEKQKIAAADNALVGGHAFRAGRHLIHAATHTSQRARQQAVDNTPGRLDFAFVAGRRHDERQQQ